VIGSPVEVREKAANVSIMELCIILKKKVLLPVTNPTTNQKEYKFDVGLS
jgi:hypothetical protein